MQRISSLLFLSLLIVVGAFIAATTGQLPARVASHFGPGDLPNGWMSRDGYLVFMLGFGLLLPPVVGAIGWLPKIAPRAINIPHRDFWLAPSRRDATLAALAAHACWLGCLLVLFIAGTHYAYSKPMPACRPACPRSSSGC